MPETNKKIAIVSGANRGIGREICKQLAEKDVFVILTARDSNAGSEVAKVLDPSGKNIIFHQLDLTNQVSINNLKSFTESEFGRLDILVNNAAIYIDGNKLTESHDWIKSTLGSNVGSWDPIKNYPPFWIDNNTLGFQLFCYKRSKDQRIIATVVKSCIVDIDENNNFYNLRDYDPKK